MNQETKLDIILIIIFILSSCTFVMGIIFQDREESTPTPYIDNITYNHVDGQPLRRIPLSSIHEYDDKIVIDCQDCILMGYQPTGSMEPTLNEAMYGIGQPINNNCSDLVIGDIVRYTLNSSIYGCSNYNHRIIDLKNDEWGWYAITKGDNLNESDMIKIRCEMIQQVLVGIIY